MIDMKSKSSDYKLISNNQFWSSKKNKDPIKFYPKKSSYKLCNECKKLKQKNEFYKDRNTKDGLRYVCKKCVSKKHKKYYRNPKVKKRCKNYQKKYSPAYRKKPEVRYSRYVQSAKKRNLNFTLSFEDFIEITNRPCYYCGSTETNCGVDRKNNAKGYTKANSVSCCIKCNRAKHSMTEKEFAEQIYKIYHNWVTIVLLN